MKMRCLPIVRSSVSRRLSEFLAEITRILVLSQVSQFACLIADPFVGSVSAETGSVSLASIRYPSSCIGVADETIYRQYVEQNSREVVIDCSTLSMSIAIL